MVKRLLHPTGTYGLNGIFRQPSLAPVPVTLPWETLTGEPRTVELYLTTPAGLAPSRSMFNSGVWKPAIRATGIPDDRHNGMHVLRHTYASVLLDAGESIKALSAYLGHADPGFTRHDHGSAAVTAACYEGQRLCRRYFQRKWTKRRPKFFESFSTRW